MLRHPAQGNILPIVLILSIYLFSSSQPCVAEGISTVIPVPGGAKLPAFYFMPNGIPEEPVPGIIVAAPAGAPQYVQYHTYCEKLACLGYQVLLFDASDFSKQLPRCPECWRRVPYSMWSWKTNILVALRLALGYEWYLKNIEAAFDFWTRFPGVDAKRILISGFSQSANAALSYAARDRRVKGVVWNCGGWPWIMPYEPDKLPPVLIFHGKQDGVYNVRFALSLARELRRAGNDHECHIYDGQRHLFNIYYDLNARDEHLNPAILSSFSQLIKFCRRVFKSESGRSVSLPLEMGDRNTVREAETRPKPLGQSRPGPQRRPLFRSHILVQPDEGADSAPRHTTLCGSANGLMR